MSQDDRSAPNKERQDAFDEPPWFVISLGAIVVVLLLFAMIAGFQTAYVRDILENQDEVALTAWGVSGDFFGFPNAVFSALAFALIIVTLWMQKHELSQQRKELEITRDVMLQQQQEMEEQNELLKKQRFEATFFRMLELHGEIVAALRKKGSANSGRTVVDDMVESIRRMIIGNEGDPDPTVDSSIRAYERWYEFNESAIGHYFRTLYNILRFVSDQQIRDEKTYTRLVRAQLSSSELELLMLNALGRRGRDKFKPLIEKYTILKHLPQDEELDLLRPEFERTAFESMDNSSNE